MGLESRAVDVESLLREFQSETPGCPLPFPGIWTAYQFFLKELRVWLGYGSLVVLDFMQIVFLVATYYFLGILALDGRVGRYGTDFFSFVVVGIAFHHFVYEIFFATDQNTRREQLWGTVEAVLVAPISPWRYALGNYTCYYVYSWFYTLSVLALGKWLLGARLIVTPATAAGAFVVSCFLVVSHLGLGLAAMGAILVSKAANPAATLFEWIQRLICGVFFPVQVLPVPLQSLAQFLPLTHALDALRLILLSGKGLLSSAVLEELLWLAGLATVLLPAGLGVLAWGYRRARLAGTLGQY